MTSRTISALSLLPIFALLLSSCSETVDPPEISYPTTFTGVAVENESAVRVFTRVGGEWVETDLAETTLDEDDAFTDNDVVNPDMGMTLVSDATVSYATQPSVTYPYRKLANQNLYEFDTFVPEIKVYAEIEEDHIHVKGMTLVELTVDGGVTLKLTTDFSPDPSKDIRATYVDPTATAYAYQTYESRLDVKE